MAALLVLYILIGVALVALGIFIVAGQKLSDGRKDPKPLSETPPARPGSER